MEKNNFDKNWRQKSSDWCTNSTIGAEAVGWTIRIPESLYGSPERKFGFLELESFIICACASNGD